MLLNTQKCIGTKIRNEKIKGSDASTKLTL